MVSRFINPAITSPGGTQVLYATHYDSVETRWENPHFQVLQLIKVAATFVSQNYSTYINQGVRKANILYRIILVFVASLFLLTYVNRAFFTHTHVLQDGTIVVHAHPYHKNTAHTKKIPVHSHTHTPAEYQALSIHIALISAFVFLIFLVNRPFLGTFFLINSPFLDKKLNLRFSTRAPPAV